jgi:hypothetical protein
VLTHFACVSEQTAMIPLNDSEEYHFIMESKDFHSGAQLNFFYTEVTLNPLFQSLITFSTFLLPFTQMNANDTFAISV